MFESGAENKLLEELSRSISSMEAKGNSGVGDVGNICASVGSGEHIRGEVMFPQQHANNILFDSSLFLHPLSRWNRDRIPTRFTLLHIQCIILRHFDQFQQDSTTSHIVPFLLSTALLSIGIALSVTSQSTHPSNPSLLAPWHFSPRW